PGWRPLPARQFRESHGKALQQHVGVGAEKLRDLAMLFRGEQAFGVSELARFGFLVAEAERQREPPRESAAAQVEHPGAFDATVADERHVRGAAADVDEDAALGPDLLVGAGP